MNDAEATPVGDDALDIVYALCKAESAPPDVFRQRVHEADERLEPLGLSVDDVLLELGKRALTASAQAKRLQRDQSSRLSIAVSNQSTPQPRPENFAVPPPSSQPASAANTPAVRTREHSVVELSSDEDEEERQQRQRRQAAFDRKQCRKFGFSQHVQLNCGLSAAAINARLKKQEAKRKRARDKRERFAVPAVPADRAARAAARTSAPGAPVAAAFTPPSENEAPTVENNDEREEENSAAEGEREPEAENSQGSARTAQKRNATRGTLLLCLECGNDLDPWSKMGRCKKCNEKRGIHERIEDIGRTYASRRCANCKTVCLNLNERDLCPGCMQVNGGNEEPPVVVDEPPAAEIDVVALDDSNDEAEAEDDDDEWVEVPRGSSSQSVGKRASVAHKRKHRSSSPAPTRRPRGRPPKNARSSGGGQLQEYLDYCLECLTPAASCRRPFLMNRCAGCFEQLRVRENATVEQGAAAAADAPFAHSHDGRTADESDAAEVLDEIVRRVADAQAEAPVEVDGTGGAPVEADGAGAPPVDANAQPDAPSQQSEAEAEAQTPREYAPHQPDEFPMDDEGQRHVIIVSN